MRGYCCHATGTDTAVGLAERMPQPCCMSCWQPPGFGTWLGRYADQMDGPTRSVNKMVVQFSLNGKTVYTHVMKPIVEGRLRQERGKPVVVGSE